MRKPKIPPEISSIWQELKDSPQFPEILLQHGRGVLASGMYLHWDELIRRPVPEGLNHRLWWLCLKLSRGQMSKDVPLRDKKGRHFRFAEPAQVNEVLHRIDLGAGGRIEMPEQITNPDTRDRYYVSSLIEEAVTSSQLEGATTTRKVAADMIRSGRPPRDKSERMILNNFLTMKEIATLKNVPLTEEALLDLHRLVTEETLEDPNQAGRYRRSDETVNVVSVDREEILHVPPDAAELPARMRAMCDFANGVTPFHFIHPVTRSILLHFWLAYDHPFVDGNGRTARALFYWSMLRNGYWLFEFISISRVLRAAPVKYARSFLYVETDDNDLTYFLLHQLEVIERSIDELHEFLKRKGEELRALEVRLKAHEDLNHRQRALVSHALRHPHHRYSVKSHESSHNVVYQTARTDLLDLEVRGLLVKRKIGRAFYFMPAPDLEEKLSKASKGT